MTTQLPSSSRRGVLRLLATTAAFWGLHAPAQAQAAANVAKAGGRQGPAVRGRGAAQAGQLRHHRAARFAAEKPGRPEGDPFFAAAELAIRPRVLATGRQLSSSNAFYLAARPAARGRHLSELGLIPSPVRVAHAAK